MQLNEKLHHNYYVMSEWMQQQKKAHLPNREILLTATDNTIVSSVSHCRAITVNILLIRKRSGDETKWKL